jgi:hypothetical protein
MGTIVEPAQSNREADSATRHCKVAEHHIAEHIEYQTSPGRVATSLLRCLSYRMQFHSNRLAAHLEA